MSVYSKGAGFPVSFCDGDGVLSCRSFLFIIVEKTYWEYVKGRVKRVVIPYWKYALCCLPAVLYIYWKHGLIISLDGVVSYVFFNPPVENRIFDHIWFISPYILISLCLPFCASFIRRYKPPFVFWGIVLILSQLFKSYYPDLLQTVVIYLFLRYGDYIMQRDWDGKMWFV